MRWLPLLIVLACPRAEARPARLGEYYQPPPGCGATPSWPKFARCQFAKTKFELVHDLPTAKLVSSDSYARGNKQLALYLLVNGKWTKSGFYAETNATNELLGFQALGKNAFRIDLGFASSTWVTLDEVSARPAILRRLLVYVCSPNGCRTVQTSCDVLVHGKAVASFRGVAKWDGRELRVAGVAQNTNRYCAVPQNLVPPDEVP